MQHNLTVYWSVYTSLCVFNPPDQGKAVGKLLKHSMSTFIKKDIERNKLSMPSGFMHIQELHFETFILLECSIMKFLLQ